MAGGDKIVVTGGTGYLGRRLVLRLLERGERVTVLSRSRQLPRELEREGVTGASWDPKAVGDWAQALEGARAVVNLAGRQAVGARYTKRVKRDIFESRVRGTEVLVEALESVRNKPRVFVCASGVGYLGGKTEDHPPLDESAPPGDDFLANVCVEWEARAHGAERLGLRVVSTRFGAVMGRGKGGPLATMSLPFKLFVGGPIGNGRQVFCWVHLEDALAALLLAIDDERVHGPVHVAAPNAVTFGEAARSIGRALHRPSWLPAPAFALKLLFGEGAAGILTGQRAAPQKLTELGFRFRFPTLDAALAEAFA